jgi:hypothetical protein
VPGCWPSGGRYAYVPQEYLRIPSPAFFERQEPKPVLSVTQSIGITTQTPLASGESTPLPLLRRRLKFGATFLEKNHEKSHHACDSGICLEKNTSTLSAEGPCRPRYAGLKRLKLVGRIFAPSSASLRLRVLHIRRNCSAVKRPRRYFNLNIAGGCSFRFCQSPHDFYRRASRHRVHHRHA